MIGLFLLAAATAVGVPPDCHAPGIMLPRPANSHAIESGEYPELSRQLGEEGAVIANVLVDETGKVTGASIMIPTGYPRLENATIDMITHRWLYLPAMRDGKPIACLNAVRVIWSMSAVANHYDLTAPGISIERMGPDDYPASARAKKEEGVSAILLHTNGDDPVEIKIITSSGYADLDAAAVARVRARADGIAHKPMNGAGIYIYAWKLTAPTL